jgi:hypothetical protein
VVLGHTITAPPRRLLRGGVGRSRRLRLPPTAQFRQVEAAVDQHFHPAGAARFQGPARSVEPHLRALHQMLGQDQVIVAKKNSVAANLVTLNETHPPLHHLLAGFALRMGLAGNHRLNGPLTVGQDANQAFSIIQRQVGRL